MDIARLEWRRLRQDLKKLSESNTGENWESYNRWWSDPRRWLWAIWWNKAGVGFSDDGAYLSRARENRGWMEEIIGGRRVSSLQNLKDSNFADDNRGLSSVDVIYIVFVILCLLIDIISIVVPPIPWNCSKSSRMSVGYMHVSPTMTSAMSQDVGCWFHLYHFLNVESIS